MGSSGCLVEGVEVVRQETGERTAEIHANRRTGRWWHAMVRGVKRVNGASSPPQLGEQDNHQAGVELTYWSSAIIGVNEALPAEREQTPCLARHERGRAEAEPAWPSWSALVRACRWRTDKLGEKRGP